MEDKRIFENIKEMLVKLFSEELKATEKTDFAGIFFDFFNIAKEYAISLQSNNSQAKALKHELSELINDIKNHTSETIFGLKRNSMANSLNELIFSTCLNKTKADPNEKIENDELSKLIRKIKSAVCFEPLCPTSDFYGFWCFLRLGFIIKENYDIVKNNLITENFKINSDGALTFLLKRKCGDEAELLYNYSGNGAFDTDLTDIYLIVKSQGKPSVFFVLKTFCEMPEDDDTEKLSFVSDTVSNGERIFSGAYILTAQTFEKSDKLNRIITFSPDNTADTAKLAAELCDYNYAVFIPPVTAAQARIMDEYRILHRNVLLVTVKSAEQLEINLKNNFYHMPANFNSQCEYIAIYQSENLFGKNAGIYIFGKIEKVALVRRYEIKEIPKDSNELYYRFSVNWETLEKGINPTNGIKTFATTSLYLLKNSKTVGELFIRNYDEYQTFKFFEKYAKKVHIIGEPECIYAITADKLRLEFTNYGVILFSEGKELFSLDRIFFKRNIKSVLKKIKEEIFGK